MLSPRRILLLIVAGLVVGGYFLAKAYFPGLTGGKAAIGLLIADIVVAPPLLFLVLRRREQRKRAAAQTDTTD